MGLIGSQYPEIVDDVGDLIETYATPDATFLPCDGALRKAELYPDLATFFEVSPLFEEVTVADMVYTGLAVTLANLGTSSPAIFGMSFNDDATRLWLNEYTTKYIVECDLAIPGDVSTATATGNKVAIGGIDSGMRGVHFNNDLSKFWTAGYFTGTVYEFDCPTPGSLAGASYSGSSKSVTAQDQYIIDVNVNPAGTRMWVFGNVGKTIFEYDLPTPGDIASAVYTGRSLSVGSVESSPITFKFDPSFTKLWISGRAKGGVSEWILPNPGSIEGGVYNTSFSTLAESDLVVGFGHSPTVEKMFVFALRIRKLFVYDIPASRSGGEFNVPTVATNPPTYIKAL